MFWMATHQSLHGLNQSPVLWYQTISVFFSVSFYSSWLAGDLSLSGRQLSGEWISCVLAWWSVWSLFWICFARHLWAMWWGSWCWGREQDRKMVICFVSSSHRGGNRTACWSYRGYWFEPSWFHHHRLIPEENYPENLKSAVFSHCFRYDSWFRGFCSCPSNCTPLSGNCW